MTVAGQPIVNYNYDANSRLTKISRDINGTVKDFSLSYDSAGRRTSLTLSNGITTNYSYDNASRLLNMKHLKSTTVLEDLLYEYDPNGNRTKYKRNATQPLRDGVTGATYDEANEMLTFTPATSSVKNMTYDNNGNMTSVANSCGKTTYTWDVRNRLAGI
ncbi:MAG: RHS repeat protein, partial [Nitrospirae bacterium]|nr:RHS repeat protein [Nitrospirota bacterium]